MSDEFMKSKYNIPQNINYWYNIHFFQDKNEADFTLPDKVRPDGT